MTERIDMFVHTRRLIVDGEFTKQKLEEVGREPAMHGLTVRNYIATAMEFGEFVWEEVNGQQVLVFGTNGGKLAE